MEGLPKGAPLAPDFQDEIIIVRQARNGQGSINVQRRRVTFIRNGVLLDPPDVQPLTEAISVEIMLQTVMGAAIPALSEREQLATGIIQA
jgi:hypothetical protein